MTGFLNAFDDVVHGFRKGAAFSLIIIGKLSFYHFEGLLFL